MSIEEKIIASIIKIAEIYTGKSISTIEEVDVLCDSGKYPELNKSVNYVLCGEEG